MKGQVRALQPEGFRVCHQVLLWRERQTLQIVDCPHACRIDTVFRPAPAIIFMSPRAEFDLPCDEGILHLADFRERLAQ